MATKKTPAQQEPDILKAAAQAIGTTLGRLALATGLEHSPEAVARAKKAPAKKKAPTVKKSAAPKAAAKRTTKTKAKAPVKKSRA
jgi:hypothetical protein